MSAGGKGDADRTRNHEEYRKRHDGIDWGYTRGAEAEASTRNKLMRARLDAISTSSNPPVYEDGRQVYVSSGAGGDTIQFRDKASYERARDFVDGKMVCKNCKHWEYYGHMEVVGYCLNKFPHMSVAESEPDFGCNKWSAK